QESTVPNARLSRRCSRSRSSSFVAEKYGSGTSPVFVRIRSGSSSRQRAAVRRSCQTIAGATGEPVAPAIVWQDRRTAARCRELDPDLIRTKTGLVPDPYFSATKLELLLREHRRDNLAFGTVDSWLVWKLTHGEHHVIDVTNASRTLLFNLETRDWDDELLALFGVPREVLPRIVGSADEVGEGELNGRAVTIRGIA